MQKNDIEKLARLARLSVKDDEQQALTEQLGNIFDWVGMLSEVDIEGVEPLYSVHDGAQRLRDDVIDQVGSSGDILGNAPEKTLLDEGGYYVVPKVVE